jgi:hypothetical protein
MNIHGKAAEIRRRAPGIDVWEDDGGAPAPCALDHQYGRRVEMDRSWTVYHVFTGEPARIDGVMLTGLSRWQATDRMLSLNRLTVLRKQERNAWMRSSANPVCTGSLI